MSDQSEKYNVVYADPPWRTKAGRPFGKYKKVDGKQIFNIMENKSRELQYDTLSVEDICSLNVKSIIAPDAHLYLWVTNQYLLKAEQVISAWGFKYSTTLVWVKKPMGGGLGGTFRITTEFLLYCTRGKLRPNKNVIGTWFDQKRQYINGYPSHSTKPDFFRDLISDVSPGKKIELFARKPSNGWDVFGNEVETSIIILP